MILISHVNKKAQTDNANNAAVGSSDFINAARSAFRVIFDDNDGAIRIFVHTKANYAPYGVSLRYRINGNGGVDWAGTSPITRQTLEAAARRRATPGEVIDHSESKTAADKALIEALKSSVNHFSPTRYSYSEFMEKHGSWIFGGKQPKRALDSIKAKLAEDGFFLRTCQVNRGGKAVNGFVIQQIKPETSIQMTIS